MVRLFRGFKLPNPGEVRKVIEGMIEGVSEVKDLPKSIVDRFTEADDDFRKADKLFRGTKLRGKKKKKS